MSTDGKNVFDKWIQGIDSTFNTWGPLPQKKSHKETPTNKPTEARGNKESRRKHLKKLAFLGGALGLTGAGGVAGFLFGRRGQTSDSRQHEHRASNEQLRTTPFNIVIVGDSNSDPKEPQVGTTGWAKKLHEFTSREEFQPGVENHLQQPFPINIAVHAVGGVEAGVDADGTNPVAAWNEQSQQHLTQTGEMNLKRNEATDLVTVMLGTNNILHGKQSVSEFINQYENMLDKLTTTLKPKNLLILAVPPLISNEGNTVSGTMMRNVNEYNVALRRMVERRQIEGNENISFKDPFASMARDVELGEQLNYDGIHLLEPASGAVAQTVAEHIASIAPEANG